MKRRAKQELGQWVSVVCGKLGNLGSFPHSPAGMLSGVLFLRFLLCKMCVFRCKDAFRIGSEE